MKKTILYSLAFLATIGLASCNEDYSDWASPQAYSQEEAAAKYGVTFANGPEANTVLPDSDGNIRLVQVNPGNDGISGITLKNLVINGELVKGSIDGYYITVPAATLSKMAFKAHGNRKAEPLQLNVQSQVSINLATGDAVTFDTEGTTTGSITPDPVPAVDPKGYFLLGHFKENGKGFDLSAPVWMTANGDGTYSATVSTSQFNTTNYFAFYRASNYDEANPTWDEVNKGKIGAPTNGDQALDEFAVYADDPVYGEPQSAGIFSLGTYVITLDPINLTYKIRRAPTEYYIYNSANRGKKRLMLYSNGDNTYTMTTKWNGTQDMKIWDLANFGNSGMFFGATTPDATTATGSVTQGTEAGFISAPSSGWYKFTLDMNSSTYQWEAVSEPTKTYTSVTVSGINKALTHLSKAPHNWFVNDVNVASVTTVHFVANDGTVWGASAAGKTISSQNYSFGVGTYDVTLPAGKYSFYLNDIDGTWNIVAE